MANDLQSDTPANPEPVISVGTVISPGSLEPATTSAVPLSPTETTSAPLVASVEPAPVAAPSPVYVPASPAPTNTAFSGLQATDQTEISWTASEFVAHHKSHEWYLALGAIAIVAAVVVYLLFKDIVSTGAIIFGALIFGIYAGHEPRQLPYLLNNKGLTIGTKQYGYGEFHSFSVIPEGAFSSIVFTPLKRFMPPLTIYYGPEDEASIVTMLADYLPLEDGHSDMLDRFMRRIHF